MFLPLAGTVAALFGTKAERAGGAGGAGGVRDTPSTATAAWDTLMVLLLAFSVAVVFWYESTEDDAIRRAIEWIDLALVAFFAVEWLVRVVRAPHPSRKALSNSWELLGMVPLLAPVPGFLRALRLLRMVRILRVFGTLGRRIGVWERIANESHIGKIALASGLVTLVGAFLVWLLERDEPATKIDTFETALWWAIVTVTTVGYGDVTPVTPTGRFVAAGLMVAGIGTIGLLASSLASVLITDKGAGKKDTANVAANVAAHASSVSAPPVMAGGLTQELATLASLHDAGKLSDDEYRRAKQRLLGV